MLKRVLIANRGEIALRVLRACRELQIETVAVHSTADAEAMHVRLADQSVCIGPHPAGESYLNKAAILSAAEISGADSVHPGYGFLSENADFARMVEDHGMTFIGPTPEHIEVMGDKIAAKQTAKEIGLPVTPGSEDPVDNFDAAKAVAAQTGYPLLIKAVSGGGGRGMTVVRSESDLEQGLRIASSEAEVAFGDRRVYIEKFIEGPRHIEVQILADTHGNVIHLGERDCTIQRRHQKVIEEAPSAALTSEQRMELGEVVRAGIQRLGYRGVGTVELLYVDGEFHFIEMNTRLQVEHPVTEMVTGMDLVQAQLRVAAGEELWIKQEDVFFKGSALEARITAEDPETLIPSPGAVEAYHPPGGPSVRIDSALYSGYRVPPYYDSLISKLIVRADTREACVRRLDRALSEYIILGMKTNIPLLQKIIRSEAFMEGDYDTTWLERFLESEKS